MEFNDAKKSELCYLKLFMRKQVVDFLIKQHCSVVLNKSLLWEWAWFLVVSFSNYITFWLCHNPVT